MDISLIFCIDSFKSAMRDWVCMICSAVLLVAAVIVAVALTLLLSSAVSWFIICLRSATARSC